MMMMMMMMRRLSVAAPRRRILWRWSSSAPRREGGRVSRPAAIRSTKGDHHDVDHQKESSSYAFATCQGGAEKVLRAEVARAAPGLRPAYSRAGLVTFKGGGTVPEAAFARVTGAAVGPRPTVSDVVESAAALGGPLRLLVYNREDARPRFWHPQAVADRADRLDHLRDEILRAAPAGLFDDGDGDGDGGDDVSEATRGLSVIVGDADEPYFVGYHDRLPRRFYFEETTDAPDNAPSRSYSKLDEALRFFRLEPRRHEVALELGSAPGGSALNLLRRGLRVYGCDPTDSFWRKHADVIKADPNFTELTCDFHKLDPSDKKLDLPTRVDWLLCDANVAPSEAVPTLRTLLAHYRPDALLFTAKLGDKLWGQPEAVLDAVEDLKAKLRAPTGLAIRAIQLPSHRHEVLLCGLTSRFSHQLGRRPAQQ